MANFWDTLAAKGRQVQHSISDYIGENKAKDIKASNSMNPLVSLGGAAKHWLVDNPLQASDTVVNQLSNGADQIWGGINSLSQRGSQPTAASTKKATQTAAPAQSTTDATTQTPSLDDFINSFLTQYSGYQNGANTQLQATLNSVLPQINSTYDAQAQQAQQAYGDAGNRIQSMYDALANDISTKAAPAQAAQYDATNQALGDIGTQAQNTVSGAYGGAEQTLQNTLKNLGISDAEANVISQDPSGALANQQAYQSGQVAQNQARAQTQNTQGKQSEGTFLSNLGTSQQQMGTQYNSQLQQQLAGLLSQIAGNKQNADAQLQLQLAQSQATNAPSITDLIKTATDTYNNEYGSYADQATAAAAAQKLAQSAATSSQVPASVIAAMINAAAKAGTSTTQNDSTTSLLNSYNPVIQSYLQGLGGAQ